MTGVYRIIVSHLNELYLVKRMFGINSFLAVLMGYYSNGVSISWNLTYFSKIHINYVKVKFIK
jgi:hypothetical protein